MNVNRFKQLLESKLGNVRPLLFEQNPTGNTPTQNVDQGKTVKVNGILVPTYDESTKKEKTKIKIYDQAYNNLGNNKIGLITKSNSFNDEELSIRINDIDYNVDCQDIGAIGANGKYTIEKLPPIVAGQGSFKIKDENMRLMLKRFCKAYFPNPKFEFYWDASSVQDYDN